MSVVGVGVDLVDVEEFSSQLDAVGTAFEASFTPRELLAVQHDQPAQRARRLAARYAAKEAFIKAWSSARMHHIPSLDTLELCEIEVLNDVAGRPHIELHGRTRAAVAESLPDVSTLVSLTHEDRTAAAFVVLDQPVVADRVPR